MSIDHGDVAATQPAAEQYGELESRLSRVEARRFRGSRWLSADEVATVFRFAGDRINLLHGELERQKREVRGLMKQVEMLRYGALPATATQGPDPMIIELAMHAQDEANRTIGEASAEGAEIIADARLQAREIIAEAQHHVASAVGSDGPRVSELQRQVRHLQDREAALRAAVSIAQQQFDQWQTHLSALSEQLRNDALAADAASQQLDAAVNDQDYPDTLRR